MADRAVAGEGARRGAEGGAARLARALDGAPRAALAQLPTPLVRGPELPGGARLWVKRDDLTGLGLGGNKARKLEFLAGAALAAGATSFVTVGAAQSNHARQTAAAGAVLGVPVRLVLGDGPGGGNQLLSALFGATTDRAPGEVPDLDAALAAERAAGRVPAAFPLGGSTPVGARGFAAAWLELRAQCRQAGIAPRAVVHATSSGGTHAGLLAARSADAAHAPDLHGRGHGPELVAAGVGRLLPDLEAHTTRLARACLDGLGLGDVEVPPARVDWSAMGPAYAVPTEEADAAIRWAARTMAIVLDRTYSGKGLAALLHHAAAGRWGPGDDVVFWHTGGVPAVFAEGGAP